MAIDRKRRGDAGLNEFALNTNRSVEYLAELQRRDGSLVFRKMAKGDPILGMILRVHKNPIRSAAWNIPYPSDATDQEKLAIDIIKTRLFGDSGTQFDMLLGKALSMLEYGFSLFEQYYEPVEIDGTMYLLPVIEQRMQTSIEEILPKEKIIKQITIDSGLVDIPFENLIFFILDQQGEDMRGQSLLRNAYRDYLDKKTYKEWLGIGIQRSVSGTPSMEVPKGTTVDSPEYIAVEQLLQNVCQQENAYMITQVGFTFDIHESKFNAEPVQKAINSANSEMALSVLAQFVMLGQQDKGGAFALSRDQSDFFLDGLQYVVNLVEGVMNDRIIRPFLKINFGDAIDPNRVVLVGKNLNKKAGKELSEVLKTLSESKFIKATTNDEVQLRSSLEMPELTEEELEERNTPTVEPTEPTEPKVKPVKLSEPVKGARKDRKNYIVNAEKEMLDFMRANLLLIKDKLIADVETVLKSGSVEIRGLKNIQVSTAKYVKSLEKKLSGIANDSWNRAKQQSNANNIKLAEPKDIQDKALKQYVLNQSQVIPDKQAAAMLNRAVLTASNNTLKGMSIAHAVANTSKSIDNYISSAGVVVDGSLVVNGTAVFGEMQFNNEISDQLWGYRFTNPAPVSDICQWYSGKTYSVDSPELSNATPPLHPNCYDDKTEVYTNNGWVKFKDVMFNNKCMTLNPETKNIEWSDIKEVVSYDYSGKMYHFTNNQKSLDFMVTPDHTHFYFKRIDRGLKGRKIEPVFGNFNKLKKANSEANFYLSSEWNGKNKKSIDINGCVISIENFCKLMGYYLSEGSIRSGYVDISQEKYQVEMYDDMAKAGFKNVTMTKGKISIYDKRIGKYLKKFGRSNEKYIPDVIKNLSVEKIRIFLDAYRLGDGSTRKTKKYKNGKFEDELSYFTSSKRMADDIGELIIKVGKSSRFYLNKCAGKKVKFKNGTYIINNNVWIIRELTSKYHKLMNIDEIDYDGIVYDLEVVKNHTLLTRRNGRVVWGSNCRSYMEPIYRSEKKPAIDDVVAPPSVEKGKTIF